MVAAILQAAAAVFAEQGYARATTNKIAERAGVSVGSLYQYFPNKDSLLGALLEAHHADVHEVVDAALRHLAKPTTSLEEGLRQFVSALVEVHLTNPTLTKALSAEVLRESTVVKHDDSAYADQAKNVAALFSRSDVRAGNPRAMAAVLRQTTGQITRWLAHDAPAGIGSKLLLEETVQLLFRYLKA